MDEVDPTKFRSAARPCTRLNDREIQQLRLGRALHKPRQDAPSSTLFPQRLGPPTGQASPRHTMRVKAGGEDYSSKTSESVFITQRDGTGSITQGLGRQRASLALQIEEVHEKDGASRKKILSGGNESTVNKTVTFAGLPSSADRSKKSLQTKLTSPLTIVIDENKLHNSERLRLKSLTKEGMDESLNNKPQGDKCIKNIQDEKNDAGQKEVQQEKEKGERKMDFLNTLLNEPETS